MTDQEIAETTPGVGALLRASRLRHGLEIDEVARVLKIKPRFLEAIEHGRLDRLPGASYALGFVKTYAEHLGLDGDEVVRRCRAESTGVDRKTRLSFPTPVAERSVPSGSFVFAGALVAMVAYGAWYAITIQDGVVAELVSPLPERFQALIAGAPAPSPERVRIERFADLAPNAASSIAATPPFRSEVEAKIEAAPTAPEIPAAAPPAPPLPVAAAPDSARRSPPAATPRPSDSIPVAASPTAPAPVVATPAAPVPRTEAPRVEPRPAPLAPAPELVRNPAIEFSGTAAVYAPATPDAPAPLAAAIETTPTAAVETAAVPAPARLDPRSLITVLATLPSWIQVRDEAGNDLLMTRLMRPGDTYDVPDRPGLRLLTGNAGALEILVDGQVAPAIGPMGAVRRDVVLDAGRLKAGTAARE